MSNLIVDKENFGKIIDQWYSIISDDKSHIAINYEILKNKPGHHRSKKHSFLKNLEKNPIKFNVDPLSFQKNLRDEWK